MKLSYNVDKSRCTTCSYGKNSAKCIAALDKYSTNRGTSPLIYCKLEYDDKNVRCLAYVRRKL